MTAEGGRSAERARLIDTRRNGQPEDAAATALLRVAAAVPCLQLASLLLGQKGNQEQALGLHYVSEALLQLAIGLAYRGQDLGVILDQALQQAELGRS